MMAPGETQVLKTQIRVGKINFINTLPFYHRLETASGIQIREGVPTQINDWMRSGAVNLAPMSSLAYAENESAYYLLPHLCIGARTFSGSVLLFSKEKIDALNGKTIVLSEESLSGSALLRILLAKRFEFQNRYITSKAAPAEMLQLGSACLVIGDTALFYQSDEFIYKYDLSELWQEWTHLPFCFSLWAVRRECFDENSADVFQLAEQLKQNTEKNLSQLSELIKDGLQMTLADGRFALVHSYFSHLVYDLTDELQNGLHHFYSLACAMKIIQEIPAFRFIGDA